MNTSALKCVLIVLISIAEIVTNVKLVWAHSTNGNHHHLHDGRDVSNDFSNQWVVNLDGTSDAADILAMKLGYENLGEVRKLSSIE